MDIDEAVVIVVKFCKMCGVKVKINEELLRSMEKETISMAEAAKPLVYLMEETEDLPDNPNVCGEK
jgi:hypothetical protein